jgi:hypothetical protein
VTDRNRRALTVLATALFLGLCGDAVRTRLAGRADLALWCAVALASATALVRGGALTAPPKARWLLAVACVLIPCLVWRDAQALFALNVLGLLGLLAMGAPATATHSLGRLGPSDLIRGSVTLGVETLAGPLPAAVRDLAWSDLPLTTRWRQVGAVAGGLAAALPLMLVFGSLFGQADPLFRQAMARWFGFDLGELARHLAIISLVSWLAAGALRGAFWREGRAPVWEMPAGQQVSVGVILGFVGGIGALFALFVGFQARELFLTSAEFQALTGVSIADYARRGFFELLRVATVTLPILLGADWLLARGDAAGVRWFRRLTAVVLVLVALLLASAWQRMLLYRSYYGLTEDRFYAMAFMTWLAGLCAWFSVTVLRDQRSRFVPGALVGGYAALLLLNLVNPDAVVARVNLERASRGAPLDADYLRTLSADAVPEVVKAIEAGSIPIACGFPQQVRGRWATAGTPWSPTGEWNFARRRAARAVSALTERPGCVQPGA